MFKTQFSGHKRYPSNPGSPFMDKYSPKVDKTGHTDVVKNGKTNFHELIQADKDSVDINLLIKRFTAGDVSAIDKVKGVYTDCRNMPENYADLLNKINECNEMFDRLPVEIKQQFDNDPNVFWSNFGDKHFLDVFGLSIIDSPTPVLDSIDESIEKEGVE